MCDSGRFFFFSFFSWFLLSISMRLYKIKCSIRNGTRLRRELERQRQGITDFITKVFSFWQMKCVRWTGDRHETHAPAATVLMCTCEWIIWIAKGRFFLTVPCCSLLCLPLPLSHSIFIVFSLIKEIFDWIFLIKFQWNCCRSILLEGEMCTSDRLTGARPTECVSNSIGRMDKNSI